jgi:peptidoglycan/xylan/chitin deacetylase (PgdA/CDA1 family)
MKTPSVYVPGPARYPRILTYHEISHRFQLGITSTTPQQFRSHLEHLKRWRFEIIPLRGLSQSTPETGVCLTFDDGYDSFYEEVLPLLVERGIPATLFIITGYVGKTNRWDITFGVNRRRHLDWERIRQIRAAGVEIGSHTGSHLDLTRLALSAVKRELSDSRQVLEDRLGEAVTSLALPFGAVNTEVIRLARAAGYIEICGSVPGLWGPLPGVLPRLPVYRWEGPKSLHRKLEMNMLELLRLGLWHNCSRGTRWIKGGRASQRLGF